MNSPADSQRGTLIAVAVIIVAGGVAGILLGRRNADASDTPVTEAPAAASTRTALAPAPESVAHTAAAAPRAAVPALGDAELAKLAEASMVGPRDARLAAIQRLSQAPREQALPLLKRVLLNGEPETDRPAALQALRALALAQGDDDQRIRDAMREVVYHGDDEAFAAQAQETIDVISRADSPSSQPSNHRNP